MSIATCPRCYRQVSLPLGDDRTVWVCCPLCSGEYSLQEALDFVPPMLMVVAPSTAGSPASDALNTAEKADFETATFKGEGADFGGIAGQRPATQLGEGDSFQAATLGDLGPAIQPAPGEQPVTGEINGHFGAAHAADLFEAAVADEHHLTAEADGELPFDAEEHSAFEHAAGEAAEDDEFRFADEHGEHIAEGEFQEAGGGDETHEPDSHAMSSIATMAAKPPKKKRKVPLTVRIIGIFIFFGVGAVGCVIVYSAFLFFGISDPLHIGPKLPTWLVAESLRKEQPSQGKKPTGDQKPMVNGQNTQTNSGTSTSTTQPNSTDASNEQKGPSDDSAKPGDKSVANNGTPQANPADATKGPGDKNPPNEGPTKPGPKDVATNPPGKADPATNPFDDPKPNGADPTKDDTKPDPLANGAGKIPDLNVPDVAIGKTPGDKTPGDKTPGDKTPGDKHATDKPMTDTPAVGNTGTEKPSADKRPDTPTPAKPPAGDPLENPVQPASAKTIDKPAEPIVPKSDASFTVADLSKATQDAAQTNKALAEAAKAGDADKLKAAEIANFRAMSHLATVLTFVKAEGPDADQLGVLKSQIADTLAAPDAVAAPAEREVVGKYAKVGINSPNRKESGLFAAGTIKKTEAHGRLFESQVELPGGTMVTVVTPQKPAVGEGSEVLLLGAVVSDPAKNLAGYEGTDEKVIFGDVLVAPAK